MSTKVYGCSDDLIEVEGDVSGEVGAYGTDPDDGVRLRFSDGTLLEIGYGKGEKGVWAIKVLKRGTLFERLDECDDEDADPYSDVAHFRDGLTKAKWSWPAKDRGWEVVA